MYKEDEQLPHKADVKEVEESEDRGAALLRYTDRTSETMVQESTYCLAIEVVEGSTVRATRHRLVALVLRAVLSMDRASTMKDWRASGSGTKCSRSVLWRAAIVRQASRARPLMQVPLPLACSRPVPLFHARALRSRRCPSAMRLARRPFGPAGRPFSSLM